MDNRMNDINAVLQAFQNMRANNTEIMQAAEASLIEYMRYPVAIQSFMFIITDCETAVVRYSVGN